MKTLHKKGIFLMLDVDGVLADWNTSFIELSKEILGKEFKREDWTQFKPYKGCLDITREEFGIVFDHIDWAALGKELTFNKFRKLSHKADFVRVITHRPECAHKATYDWLTTHDVRFDEISFTREKWNLCEDLTHVADDRDDTLLNIAVANPNIRIFPVPRIYNKQHLLVRKKSLIQKIFTNGYDTTSGYEWIRVNDLERKLNQTRNVLGVSND